MKGSGLKKEIKEELDDLDKSMERERKNITGDRSGLVDLVTAKIISRKLLVWITATVLLMSGLITDEQWAALSLGYVGVEGFASMASMWKHGK